MSSSPTSSHQYRDGRLVHVPKGSSFPNSTSSSSSGTVIDGKLTIKGDDGFYKRALEIIPGDVNENGVPKKARFIVEGDRGTNGKSLTVTNDKDAEGVVLPLTTQQADVAIKVTNNLDEESEVVPLITKQADVAIKVTNDLNGESEVIPLKAEVTSIPTIKITNEEDESEDPVPLLVKGNQGLFSNAVTVAGSFGTYNDTIQVMPGNITETIDGNPVTHLARFNVVGTHGEHDDSVRITNDVLEAEGDKVPIEVQGQKGANSMAIQITNDKDAGNVLQPLTVQGDKALGSISVIGSYGLNNSAVKITNDTNVSTPIPIIVQGDKGTADAINVRTSGTDVVQISTSVSGSYVKTAPPHETWILPYPTTDTTIEPWNHGSHLFEYDVDWPYLAYVINVATSTTPMYLSEIVYKINGTSVGDNRLYFIASNTAHSMTGGSFTDNLSDAPFTWNGSEFNTLIYSLDVTLNTFQHVILPRAIPYKRQYLYIYYGSLTKCADVPVGGDRDGSIIGARLIGV